MIYSDLHCDSLTRAFHKKEGLLNATGHISAEKSKVLKEHRQCFAVFTPDGVEESTAFSYYNKLYAFYLKEKEKLKSTNIKPVLTIENAACLGGDINNVELFKHNGVKMLSLTWNGENSLGYGCENSGGDLKDLGKRAVKECEKQGITLDCSHLSERGFYTLCDITEKPFMASHSNCYFVCPHRRNLKDEQLKIIIERCGLIGLCFYPPFLCEKEKDIFSALYENIYHILSLGGENSLAFGSDFDGGEMSQELDGTDKLIPFYHYLKGRGLEERILDKLFYLNAENFLGKRETFAAH